MIYRSCGFVMHCSNLCLSEYDVIMSKNNNVFESSILKVENGIIYSHHQECV